ncbi:hypothetical protein MNBD_ALPHA11-806 [hydrothermal vent metagenome]|uniref:Uncharacterized protein n=1 Tax=hydrothermal vent metagenome TaxID=652676 RepID=A0A3B0TVY5_9ZZZZ
MVAKSAKFFASILTCNFNTQSMEPSPYLQKRRKSPLKS